MIFKDLIEWHGDCWAGDRFQPFPRRSSMIRFIRLFLLTAPFALACGTSRAGELVIPHSFSANTPAVAAQVNANFSATKTAVDDNDTRIAALEAALTTLQGNLAVAQGQIASMQNTITAQATTIATLQSNMSAVQANTVLDLDEVLELTIDPRTGQSTARFSGVNVQVVNGEGTTPTRNGVGNLIIGYNELPGLAQFCSLGEYNTNYTTCVSNGGTWAANQRSGSHNLILGNRNGYTGFGGLVAGFNNIVNGIYASVSGGSANIASGDTAAVSGGLFNKASGGQAVVSGGESNTASGLRASVSGGNANTASGNGASVSGGTNRSATGLDDWRAGSLFENY
ncbi:MAG: hypothetical protein R3F12_15690 [Lysobacteraceae bacterium]